MLQPHKLSTTGTTLGVVGVGTGMAATLVSMSSTLTAAVGAQIAACVALGGAFGAWIAKSIKITELPQMVRRALLFFSFDTML